jgi:hypothetical protein
MRASDLALGALVVLFLSATAGASCDSSSDDEDDGETEETETEPQPNGCNQSQFECGSGECISNTYLCDGPAQCSDGSDESPVNPNCGTPDVCEPTEFACSVTQCLPLISYCNGFPECDNGNDEVDCTGCALPDPTPPIDCEAACGDVYDCGVILCSGTQLCPGFSNTVAQRDLVVTTCLDICAMSPTLINVVNPANCSDTISVVSSINSDFEFVCQNGT